MKVKANAFVAKVEIAYQEKWGYIWATAGELWTEAKQKALEKKYYSDPVKYADYKQGAEEGSKWIGHRVTDCSGLPKKALADLGIKSGIYHGSNSQFKKNCSKTGKITKDIKIPIGALIFTGDETTHNHVGVLVTDTCVCEAKGTASGVVHTPLSNKKWTYWGLLNCVDYGETTATEKPTATSSTSGKVTKPTSTVTSGYSTLRRGMKGELVRTLQTILAKDGSTLEIDGIFGIGTQSAVKSFQKRHGLVVDGIVGPKTWAELLKI